MTLRQALIATLTVALLMFGMTATALAHGAGGDGEETSYALWAVIPAAGAALVTGYLLYRIFKGKPSS